MDTKECYQCKKDLPFSSFPPSRYGGLTSRCEECTNAPAAAPIGVAGGDHGPRGEGDGIRGDRAWDGFSRPAYSGLKGNRGR